MKVTKKIIKKFQGFTLIEILIACSIVGVLASFLFANLIDIKKKARDEERKTDIIRLQTYLEEYHSDNSSYPVSSSGGTDLNNTPCNQSFTANNIIYLSRIPCDPLGQGSDFNNGSYYYYSADGKSYIVAACLERKTDPDGQSILQ